MSFNQNFYNNPQGYNFHSGTIYSFPPPPPPSYLMSPTAPTAPNDQEFVKTFESRMMDTRPKKHYTVSISSLRNMLFNVYETLKKTKCDQNYLTNNMNTITDSEWQNSLLDIKKQNESITLMLSNFNELHINLFKKLVAKRSAKRLRMKKVAAEKKLQKNIRVKQLQERSRKIDENLQKIKNDINKVKQEEKAKLEADSVLKDVLRKKHNAKRCIVKVDALTKLRKARHTTAIGRGEAASDKDAEDFNNNIEKLKSLWQHKLLQYEKEETELRSKLQIGTKHSLDDDNKVVIEDNILKWKEFLFGADSMPQVNLNSDKDKFISIRSQWDQYVNPNGTSLPLGWVIL